VTDALVHLVKGDDPVLRADVVMRVVDGLLGGEDRSLAVDDLEITARARGRSTSDDDAHADDDDPDPAREAGSVEQPVFRRVVTALQSPPFMTSRRIVVVRNVADATAEQAALLAEYVSGPADGTFLVMVQHGGRMPGALDKAIKAAKVPVHVPEAEATAKGSKNTSVIEAELHDRLAEAGVKLHTDARARVVEHLGDDAARVAELVEVLGSRFVRGSTIRAEEVEPYLGAAGAIEKRWELTGAIDAGDTPRALDLLHRLMQATSAKQPKVVHPMQLMATLHGHYSQMLWLDSPDVATKEDAAAVLGGSPWAAKFRLDASRRLGTDGLREAFVLLAQADLDLRGVRAIPEETVMQVLVARLSALSRRSGAVRSRTG